MDQRVANQVDELVTTHVNLVHHVLNQLALRLPRHVDRSELWSAGAAGLVDAARRFDPDAGVPFATYAAVRVRGAMIDATRTEDLASRGVRRGMRRLDATRAELEQRTGTAPSLPELAAALGLTVAEVERLRTRAARATVLRLDQPAGDGQGATLGQQLATSGQDDPDARLEQQELLGMVRAGLHHLPATQREVLRRHYFGGELFREVAADLGVTEARVSQLRAEALNALRAYLRTQEVNGLPEVPDRAPGARRRATYLADMQALTTWRSVLDEGAKAEAVA